MPFQRKLKVGCLLDNYLTTDKKDVFQEIDVRLIQLLSFALGYDYQLLPSIDKEIGRELNGSWTGFIGMVNRSELDFAVSGIGMTAQRIEGTAWTFPFLLEPVTFVTHKPQYKTQLDSYLLPFSYTVWSFLMASLIIVSIVLHGVSSRRFGFQRAFLSTYSAVLQKSMDVVPVKASEYFVVSSWIIGMAFFSYSYTALLLSFMSIPTLTGVRTVPELAAEVAKGSYKCFTVPGAFFNRVLYQSNNPAIRIIGEDLEANPGTRDMVGVLEGVMGKEVPAYILRENPLQHFSVDYFISKDRFFNAFVYIPMRKQFCCKRELNKAVHHIWAAGLNMKIMRDDIYKKTVRFQLRSSNATKSDTLLRKLTVDDFKGAFIFLVFGYTLSLIVLVIERISAYIKKT